MATEKKRCVWPGEDALYVQYHDEEWGVPEHDDDKLFEKLILDGFQAGLSWITILRKRDNFRRAFDRFDVKKIARYDAKKVARLVDDAGIIRSRAKIDAAIGSAQAFLRIKENGRTFDDYLWQFTGGKVLQGKLKRGGAIPTQSPESVAMSKQLKKDGFKFCGPVICYAFMQAVGMVNDHVSDCFRHKALAGKARK